MGMLSNLSVTFPKTVKIENKRLAIMYYVLAAAALAFVLSTFISDRAYLRLSTPTGRVFFWVNSQTWDLSSEKAQQVNQDYGALDVCSAPERFEYWDSEGGAGSNYVGMKCMDLCTDEITQGCTEKTERWFKEDRGIFFPTYFNETVTSFSTGEKVVTNKQRIVKGVEEMKLAFDHQFQVTTPKKQQGQSKDDEGNLLTILLDANGKELQRWLPGETVSIPLRTMLSITGFSLDTVNDAYGRNYLENSEFSDGVLARIAGAEIDVELSYTNINVLADWGWNGNVCLIEINTAQAWTSRPMVDAFDQFGSQRLRYYQGLRVRFTTGGVFGQWNVNMILNGLTSILVFVASAKKLTLFFTTTCLGALSHIYLRFIEQDASLEKDACGLAARLTAHTSSFLELKDTPHGITKDRLNRRFERIFAKEGNLNTVEIARLADYVFDRMNTVKIEDIDVIDIEEYSVACAAGEQVSVRSLIDIFDADRKKNCFEKFFLDDSVRALLKSDEELQGEKGKALSLEMDKNLHHASQGKVADEGFSSLAITAVKMEGSVEEEEEEVEVDALTMLHHKSEALHQHAHKLSGDHEKLASEHHELKGTVDSHRSEMDSLMQTLQERVDANVGKLEALQRNEQEYSRKLESFNPFLESLKRQSEDVERLKRQSDEIAQQSEQLQSELEKLKRRNAGPSSQGMVVEETTRRVISKPEAAQGATARSASSQRDERPCGIPSAWDLCTERPQENGAHIDVHDPKDKHVYQAAHEDYASRVHDERLS